jgi:hypothetical protein
MESETPSPTKISRRIPSLADILNYIDTNWHYPRAEKRDLRLDFLRGFAVFVMVVDHFGGTSWFYYLTGNNQFFTSGAEAFVLISGMVVGLVYGNMARRDGLKPAIIKVLQRAWTLYKLTIVMTLVFAVVSDIFNLPWSKDVDISDPLLFVFRVVILQQTYYLADIPMLYTFLMLVAPIGLYLLYHKRTGILHFVSFALWAGFQYVDSQGISIFPIMGNTTFHPAAWQLIFFWAMTLGYHRERIWKRIGNLPKWPYFLLSTLLFVWLLNIYSTELGTLKRFYSGVDVQWIVSTLFSKSHVAPGRMLATMIVFQFAYLLLTFFWLPFEKGLGWLLTPLGQNSLYSYTMHVVILGTFYAILPYLPGNITERGTINTLLQLGVLFLLWWLIRRQFAFDIIPR